MKKSTIFSLLTAGVILFSLNSCGDSCSSYSCTGTVFGQTTTVTGITAANPGGSGGGSVSGSGLSISDVVDLYEQLDYTCTCEN